MPKFRTVFPPVTAPFTIGHTDRILSVGSCFAEHIPRQMERLQFPVLRNPFGIVYNPVSVLGALEWLTDTAPFPESHLVEYGGLWHSFDHHGAFSRPEKSEALAAIQSSLERGRAFWAKTTTLLITFGT
ncbi:MAG: hypothetical protein D6714_10890, partial [Bacteroidetes bacterium]